LAAIDMSRKLGRGLRPLFGREAGSPSNTKSPGLPAEAYLHTKWHFNKSSHLAEVGAVPLWVGELRGRGLHARQLSS